MGIVSREDIDYGIVLVYPKDWKYMNPSDTMLRYAIKGGQAIVASILPLDLVEKGLRAISSYVIKHVFSVKPTAAKVVLNYEEEGIPRRTFEVVVETDSGEYLVRGIIELVSGKRGNTQYYEYFLKCIASRKEHDITQLLPLLDRVSKKNSGIPIGTKLHIFQWLGPTPMGDVEELGFFCAPAPTIVGPTNDGVIGLLDSLTFQIRVLRFPCDLIDESFAKGELDRKITELKLSVEEVESDFADERHIVCRAISPSMIVEIHVTWGHPVVDNDTVVRVFTFTYSPSAEYGARRIINTILATWRETSSLFGKLFPYIPTHAPSIPSTSTIGPVTNQEKIQQTTVISIDKRKDEAERKRRMEIEECKRRIRFLKMKIDDVKQKIRLLDYDYRTKLEVLGSIKSGELITGMYTFKNPAGKTRFIHSKTRSPIVGDRFWEHKDRIYLPDNKAFYSTSKFLAPYPRHEFRELKWKVEEDRKKVEEEYRRKRKQLEEELRKLEEELRKYQAICG